MATSIGLIELWVVKDEIKYKIYNQSKGLNLSNIELIKRIETNVYVI
jgi:hypothetical protein